MALKPLASFNRSPIYREHGDDDRTWNIGCPVSN
jgi:hypothetical protein